MKKTEESKSMKKKQKHQIAEEFKELPILQEVPVPLLKWYAGHARILPWRSDPAPYRVWISEIMLQQTRVSAVMPFFERFTKELPDVSSLAQCDEDRLMKLWEGLGYYSRARNLQKAARMMVETYQAALPSEVDDLLKLPGIGSYTAGAVASIAFGKPIPAVDGNVIRVICRVAGVDKNMDDTLKEYIGREILKVIPEKNPGDFNQALMELGAMVCVPNGLPLCAKCPLADICTAKKEGRIEDLPRKPEKKPRKIIERLVFVFIQNGQAALLKRPDKGLLASLWELPAVDGGLLEDAAEIAEKTWGIKGKKFLNLGEAKHIFTHLEWRMQGVAVFDAVEMDGGVSFHWAGKEALNTEYALPSAFKKYSALFPKLLEMDKTEKTE